MNPGGHRGSFVALVLVMTTACWPVSPVVAAVPFEVDAVQSAKSLPSRLEVVGVVAKRNASTGTFSLIDREEFRKCRSVGCANFLLPVRWSGTLPSIASVIKVRGTLRDTQEGMFLFAESVEAAGK